MYLTKEVIKSFKMNELETFEILIEKLEQRIKVLKKNGVDNVFADICVKHTNDKLAELLNFLKP